MEIKHSVLIVEDELPIRRFLRASLSANAYEVIESATGQEGLLQAASRNPDVIILAARHRRAGSDEATARVDAHAHHRAFGTRQGERQNCCA